MVMFSYKSWYFKYRVKWGLDSGGPVVDVDRYFVTFNWFQDFNWNYLQLWSTTSQGCEPFFASESMLSFISQTHIRLLVLPL